LGESDSREGTSTPSCLSIHPTSFHSISIRPCDTVSVTALLMKWPGRLHRHVAGAQEILVIGEVLDMTCYIASNLSGPDHVECARVCIRNGLLADYAAKIVTIKGRQTMRGGFAQLQIEEIQKL
jgi:hypothetical protein